MMKSFILFCVVLLIAHHEASDSLESDHPERLLDLNRRFFGAHDLYKDFLVAARNRQIHDERMLQTQFVSRIAFVASQMKDVETSALNQIDEHGSSNCIDAARESLRALSQEIGEELMEISSIARKDFNRIPAEFVHPRLETTERQSQGFINNVLMRISTGNSVTEGQRLVDELEAHLTSSENSIANIEVELQTDIDYKRRQMNYVKAEVFPILEYSLRFYQRETDSIIANLINCN